MGPRGSDCSHCNAVTAHPRGGGGGCSDCSSTSTSHDKYEVGVVTVTYFANLLMTSTWYFVCVYIHAGQRLQQFCQFYKLIYTAKMIYHQGTHPTFIRNGILRLIKQGYLKTYHSFAVTNFTLLFWICYKIK